MTTLTWQQTIRLGSQAIRNGLRALGIAFNASMRYFSLCSLFYRHQQALPVQQPQRSDVSQYVNNIVPVVTARNTDGSIAVIDSDPERVEYVQEAINGNTEKARDLLWAYIHRLDAELDELLSF